MSSATRNNNRVAEPRINDGLISVDVNLRGSGDDSRNAWEAAGVIWSTPTTISQVRFYNGAADSAILRQANGEFSTGVDIQFTTNGSAWQTAGWTLTPIYVGNAITSASKWYDASGPKLLNVRGMRVAGQVRTSANYSWYARVNEIEAYGCAN